MSKKINIKNINNFVNNIKVEPLEWILPNRKEFIEWLNRTFIKYRSDGKKYTKTNYFTPFKYQKFLRDYMQNNSPYRGILLYHSVGSGKCHGKDTMILLYNGNVKAVQNIIVGDLLMGDDSTPRRVLSLARGRDKMYKIIQSHGKSYIVNSEHILCLKMFPNMNYNNINNYYELTWIKNNIIQFKNIENKLIAYEFYHEIIEKYSNNILEISVKDYLNLSNENKFYLKGYKTEVLYPYKQLNVEPYTYGYELTIKNYNINRDYLINSKENRLNFLAGIIDCNGELFENNYKINLENNLYNDDIIQLVGSLGLYITNNLIIYGNIYNIPSKKYKVNNKNFNNYLVSDIIVNYINVDDYYGFMLDNNCRYLLDDYTVTHNTCTSITIAENLKTERNIVVMLPASIKSTFIDKGLLFCGAKEYQNSPNLIKDKYSFISYNANNTISQIKNIGSLDNKVIIIDEVHNLISKMMSGLMGMSKQGLEIYKMLMEAQNVKIVALSGTPIINDPFEVAILFNILRGYIEITYFRIIKSNDEELKINMLENELLKNKLIDYIEINKINKSIEFHIKIYSYSPEYRELIDYIERICSSFGLIVKFLETIKKPLFSTDDDGNVFKNLFIKEDLLKGDSLKNENIFKRRILGLISYYKPTEENFPTLITNDYYRIEMSDYQYQIYEILRAKERLSERGSASKKIKKKIKSTFRVFSRQACNFVFPEEINRPYPDPSFVVSILKNKNNTNKNIDINKLMMIEENIDDKMKIEYKNRIQTAIHKLVENGNKYFKEEGLNKLSPKMLLILENIKKSEGLCFVYSNFRTLEGVELFSKVLDFNGYDKFNIGNTSNGNRYAIYSGMEDEILKKEILKVFTSPENKYGNIIKIILATSAGSEGLDLKNIRQIHIMEPYWNQMRIEQVIGRGVRRDSHIDLPEKDRNVEIFRYFSILPKKNIAISKEKISTDEYIEQISLKKQNIINEILLSFKECSVDCFLNLLDTKGDYKCFSFGTDASGFSYFPNISKNIIETYAKNNTKISKRSLTKAIYYNKHIYLYYPKNKIFYLYHDNNKNPVNIDIKKASIKFIDLKSGEVFNKKSVNAGNPLIIGTIDKNGKFIKK
jgi:hypothetical protein